MVAIRMVLCALGLVVLEAFANPIAYVHRSANDSVTALGVAPVRRGTGSIGTSSSSLQAHGTSVPRSTPSSSRDSVISSSWLSFKSDSPFGISYSPYTSSGGCKDVSSISSDLHTIANEGYQIIRLYGTDCNQVSNVVSVLSSTGINLKLFLGIFDLGSASSQISTIVSAIHGNWNHIVTISIGNEPVNQGIASVSTVIRTTRACRSQLRSAGYNGPVVAVDTFIAILNNPSLCEASDYIAANAHPFFDGNVAASGAGAWLAQQASKLAAICGKDVLITESGWPSRGSSNGAAVPSAANQATAKSSILSRMGNKCIMFSAFNDHWKSPGQYGVEQYWGLLN